MCIHHLLSIKYKLPVLIIQFTNTSQVVQNYVIWILIVSTLYKFHNSYINIIHSLTYIHTVPYIKNTRDRWSSALVHNLPFVSEPKPTDSIIGYVVPFALQIHHISNHIHTHPQTCLDLYQLSSRVRNRNSIYSCRYS